MQTRFSTCRGMEIIEQSTGDVVGYLVKPLIEPDKGVILGFFVFRPHTGPTMHYVSALDIIHFGMRVEIRDEQYICDPYDIVRLQTSLDDSRVVLGQRIQTESGSTLGVCRDVQFDTETMHLTWLFPKRWFRWADPLPIRTVMEIRPDAIIVQDVLHPAEEESITNALSAPFTEPGV